LKLNVADDESENSSILLGYDCQPAQPQRAGGGVSIDSE